MSVKDWGGKVSVSMSPGTRVRRSAYFARFSSARRICVVEMSFAVTWNVGEVCRRA